MSTFEGSGCGVWKVWGGICPRTSVEHTIAGGGGGWLQERFQTHRGICICENIHKHSVRSELSPEQVNRMKEKGRKDRDKATNRERRGNEK